MQEKNPKNEFKELISKLGLDNKFKEWKTSNPQTFLSYIFVMFDKANKDLYQVGYYDEKKEDITTFIIKFQNSKIIETNILKSSEFIKSDSEIKKLDLQKVNFNSKEIINIAEKFKKEKYKSLPTLKSFFILQNLDGKQIFNFTFMTASFKTLNIKISSEDGAIVDFSLKSLINILK